MLKINELARLHLGVKGENLSRTIEIDMSAWADQYPNATAEILHKRYGDQTKALTGATYDSETMILSWTPTDYDTFYEGYGLAEIRMVEDEVVKKTKDLIVTAVCPSVIDGSGTVVASDYQAFLNSVIGYKNGANTAKIAAEAAQEAAEEAAEHAEAVISIQDVAGAEATTLEPGESATAEIQTVDNQKKFVFGIPKGSKGDTGSSGQPGTSAYVYIRYSATEPAQDSDMKTTPDEWMGIYSGSASTAPEHYTDYTWYKIKGQSSTGTIAGVKMNGSEVPLDQYNVADLGTVVTSHQDISGKADKVDEATSGNFAGLDANGNLTDSGHKHSDYLTSHQDISGKADKVSGGTSGNFAGLDANGNLTDSGSKASDFLTSHQDISGKADKVSGGTSGNFAGLDSNGNLTDSGSKAGDFLTPASIYDGLDKNSSGYALDAAQGKILSDKDTAIRRGLMHVAKLSSGNWILSSGDNAAIGDALSVNGTLGVATAAITGGSTVLVKNTNWEVVSGGILNLIISLKADKVSGATSGNFAGLDANGNLTDSGHKHSDYLTSHQDISGKADKVSGGTSGNFAGIDGNGNLTDSGHKHSDYLTAHQDISGKANKGEVATMATGDTHIAISSGEYVSVRNHSTLADGLYRATANIAQDGALSLSNLEAQEKGIGGAVNTLDGKVGNVSRCGRVLTSTSNGQASFQMENGTQGFVAIGGNAPVVVGMTNGGTIFNSAMPSGYTISQSGNTVTITKTQSVSTSVAVTYMFIL